MALEKSQINWSAKQIMLMVKNGKINFDHIVQRSFVWERKRKTGLIESIILGYPVPSIFAKRITEHNNNVYYIMDGKQRLSTIKQFLNNEFALTPIPPVKYVDIETGEEKETNISGCTYNKLPESLQDIIKDTMFSVIYFDDLTKSEEKELFKRLNAGKPLTAKAKILATSNDAENLLRIGQHKLFSQMYSKTALDNKNQVSTVAKIWIMLNVPINEISFEGKVFTQLLEEVSIDEDEEQEMNRIFDFVVDIYTTLKFRKYLKAAKKLYIELHLVSLIPYINKALELKYSDDQVAEWINHFFGNDNGTSINEEYNKNCIAKVSRTASIIARDRVLSESFTTFFERN